MTDDRLITEDEGCAILHRCFTDAGFTLKRDYPIDVGGHTLTLDGYDVERQVGFEYLTREAGDDAEFHDEAIAALEAKMAAGELMIFLVDETFAVTEGSLRRAADRFLERARGVR